MENKKLHKTLLALSIAAIISGCGGGGGGSYPVGSSFNSATVSGKAAKGIIIDGDVTANELNTDGTVKNAGVGSAVTGADGSYSLTLNSSYEGGPIEIKVTANTNTTTVCDATSGCGNRTDGLADTNTTIEFGEQYKPANLSMTALLPDADDGESIDVQVTPFTNMAAARAKTAGTLDAATVAAANSEVSDLLGGLDILNTEPVDITNLTGEEDAGAVAYAALAASIAEIADDDADGQPDIAAALNDLAADFASGTFAADDMQVILDEAISALTESGATDTSGLIASIQDDVTTAGSGGTLDPEANENAGDSNVELAKAFIQDLRTWGSVIDAETTNPSQAFETQIEMADDATFFMDGANDKAISAAFEAIFDYFDGVLTASDLTNYQTIDGTFTAGTISSASTSAGVVYTVSNATVTTADGTGTVNLVLIAPQDLTTVTSVVFGIQSVSAEDDFSILTGNSGTISMQLATPYALNYNAMDPPTPEVDSIAFDFDASVTMKKTTENNQIVDAADPVTFAGNIGFTVHTLLDGNNEIIDGVPGSMTFGGNVSNTTGESFDMSFSVSIPNASTVRDNPLTTVYDLDSTYFDNNGVSLISWETTVNTFDYQNPDESYSVTFNPNDNTVRTVANSIYFPPVDITDGPYASLADFAVSNPFYPNDYTYWYWVDGQGEYMRDDFGIPDYSTTGSVVFTLDELDDVEFFDMTQPLIGSVGMQFTAQFDGLPEADISLTGTTTAYEAGNATVTVSYGTRQLEFSASNDTANGETGSVMITNLDGVVLTLDVDNLENLDPNDDVQTLTINTVIVANIIDMDNGLTKVEYIDGTFEIF